MRRPLIAAALGAVLSLPAGLSAQGRQPTLLTVAAGASRYDLDLSGTGTGFVAALRSPILAGRVLIIEPGVTFFTYKNQLNRRTNLLLPELSIQAGAVLGGLRPFLGAGIGFTSYFSGPNRNDLTLHATAGARIAVSGSWGFTGEARIRSIDPFSGTTADFTFGVTRVTFGGS